MAIAKIRLTTKKMRISRTSKRVRQFAEYL